MTSLSAGRMFAPTSLTAASAAAARLGVAGLRHWLDTAAACPSPAMRAAVAMMRSHAGPKRRWQLSAFRHSSLTALSIASALLGLLVSTPIESGGRLVAAANIDAVWRSCAACGSKLAWVNVPTCGRLPCLSRGSARTWSSMICHRGLRMPFLPRNMSSVTPRKYRGGTEYSSACTSERRKVRTALSVRLMTVRLMRDRPNGRLLSGRYASSSTGRRPCHSVRAYTVHCQSERVHPMSLPGSMR